MTSTVETRGNENDEAELRQGIAARLRGDLAMKPKRISQAKIARELGITQQSLSSRMVGDVSFRADELIRICRFVDIDVVYVLTGKRAGTLTHEYLTVKSVPLNKRSPSSAPRSHHLSHDPSRIRRITG